MSDSQKTIRAFVAIDLHDEARAALGRLQDTLKEALHGQTVRWTPPKNIHLTLHFLGNVSVHHLETLSRTVRDVAAVTPSFSLRLGNLGCFPNVRRPRIVWVAVAGETDILIRLQHELGKHLQKGIGFQPEAREYSPHLTIGRVKRGIPQQQLGHLGRLLETEAPRVGQLATLAVERVHLIRSDLKPEGPAYTRMAEGYLVGKSET